MVLSRDVRHLGVRPESSEDYDHNLGSWINLAVFLLCIPAGYVVGSHGPYVLLLLGLAGRAVLIRRALKHAGVQRLVHRFHRQA